MDALQKNGSPQFPSSVYALFALSLVYSAVHQAKKKYPMTLSKLNGPGFMTD